MTSASPRPRAATGPVPLPVSFSLRSPRSRLERAAEAAPVSTHLDPAEADVLRRALESGYRHARDAAAQAWSTSERSARMRLAAELMTLAFAEQPEHHRRSNCLDWPPMCSACSCRPEPSGRAGTGGRLMSIHSARSGYGCFCVPWLLASSRQNPRLRSSSSARRRSLFLRYRFTRPRWIVLGDEARDHDDCRPGRKAPGQ